RARTTASSCSSSGTFRPGRSTCSKCSSSDGSPDRRRDVRDAAGADLVSQLPVPEARPALDGEPIVIVQDGKPLERTLNRERLTVEEVLVQARQQQLTSIDQIEWPSSRRAGRSASSRSRSPPRLSAWRSTSQKQTSTGCSPRPTRSRSSRTPFAALPPA